MSISDDLQVPRWLNSSEVASVGSGAALGYGLGPFRQLLSRCDQATEKGSTASRVQQAIELAHRAGACCSSLPQVAIPTMVGRKDFFGWPPTAVQLLTDLSGSAQKARDLCARGASATVRWAVAAAESISCLANSSTALLADAWDHLRSLIAEVGFLASLRAQTLQSAAATLALEDGLRAALLTLGAGATMTALFSQEGSEDFQELEVAVLARYFCAAAATAQLELRAVALAVHVTWLTPTLHLERQVLDDNVVQTLRLAAEILSGAESDAVVEPWVPRSKPYAGATNAPLLVLRVPPKMLYADVWTYASQLRHHFEKSGAAVRVVWEETYFLIHGPMLAARFRDQPAGRVDVVYRPLFGLDERDGDLWRIGPTQASELAANASAAWLLELKDKPLLLLSGGAQVFADDSSPAHKGQLPLSAGCWFRLPQGCPASNDGDTIHGQNWQRDAWGERNFGALDDPAACGVVRREAFRQWCGTSEVEMVHVPPEMQQGPTPSQMHATLPEVLEALQLPDSASSPKPRGVLDFQHWHVSGIRMPRWDQVTLTRASALWQTYLDRQKEAIARAAAGDISILRKHGIVVWACQPAMPCGGHGDRLKGIVATFVLAILTDRFFFIDAPDPWDLRLFMAPNALDWRVTPTISGLVHGRHVLWDHDYFMDFYLDHLLASNAPWVVYTNKISFIGPLMKHPRLFSRAMELELLEQPYLTAKVWKLLFRPTPALDRHWQRLKQQLGGPGSPFIALHYRSGDLAAGFGVVNGEIDVRSGLQEVLSLLGCADLIERQLKLPSSTRWFLASDNRAVLEVPQVATWRQQGKLVVREGGRAVHLAVEGVVPPSGAPQEQSTPGAAQQPALFSAIEVAESLAGVADSWVDFLALSQATAAVVSSSAFGIMAASAGALNTAYSASGCARLDLLV